MPADFTTNIVLHHVGGRGFDITHLQPGPFPAQFFQDVVHVVYEADESAAQEMANRNPHRENFFVVPFALGASNCVATLNIAANPYASSLLRPDPEFDEATCEVLLEGLVDGVELRGVYYDALYSNENRVVKTAQTELRTLDQLLRSKQLGFNHPPDLLVLDTQGTEHDVLNGAQECVAKNVLGVCTEVEFLPMYAGQRLAYDIFKKMDENGFYFAGFTYLQGVSTYKTPIGLRAKDFTAFGDCLFLRRIEAVRRVAQSPDHLYVMLRKLAFISLTYGYLSYAMKVLAELASLTVSKELQERLRAHRYESFLERLSAVASAFPIQYLYTDRYVLARDVQQALAKRLAAEIESPPPPPPAPLRRYTVTGALARIRRTWITLLGGNPTQPKPPPPPPVEPPSPIEMLLDEYGFGTLAAEVRVRRLRAQAFFATVH